MLNQSQIEIPCSLAKRDCPGGQSRSQARTVFIRDVVHNAKNRSKIQSLN